MTKSKIKIEVEGRLESLKDFFASVHKYGLKAGDTIGINCADGIVITIKVTK